MKANEENFDLLLNRLKRAGEHIENMSQKVASLSLQVMVCEGLFNEVKKYHLTKSGSVYNLTSTKAITKKKIEKVATAVAEKMGRELALRKAELMEKEIPRHKQYMNLDL